MGNCKKHPKPVKSFRVAFIVPWFSVLSIWAPDYSFKNTLTQHLLFTKPRLRELESDTKPLMWRPTPLNHHWLRSTFWVFQAGIHACLCVCPNFLFLSLFYEDMVATTAVQEKSQNPHRFAAAAVTLPFRLPHNCCSFLNRSWGLRCCGFLSGLRPPPRGSWAFGEVVAEDSLLRHMTLSQFSAQTWKTTLWPLHTYTHTHIHAWTYNNTHHWRSIKAMIKMAFNWPLRLVVMSILSIVLFAVSWPE